MDVRRSVGNKVPVNIRGPGGNQSLLRRTKLFSINSHSNIGIETWKEVKKSLEENEAHLATDKCFLIE